MVSCILGARTPGGSWVWAQTSNAWIHLSMSDLCQRSQWSRSLQVESRASPSLSLEECLAGAEMTVDSLDWVTHKVLQWKFKSLTVNICQYRTEVWFPEGIWCTVYVLKVQVSKYTCNIQYFVFLIDRHTPTPVHYLHMKKTVSISCGKDHTAALTKVSQQQLTGSHKIKPPEQAAKQLNAEYDLNELWLKQW